MRQYLYDFAHKILPHDVHEEPKFWGIISSDRAASYLMKRWSDAGGPKGGPIWIEPVQIAGAEIRIIRLPPAQDLTEAHYVAVVKSGDKLRYFVAEQGSERVNLAEWTSTTQRIKYGPLDEDSNALFELNGVPSRAAPWEVSRDAIRGLPYVVSFLDNIRQELTGQPATPGTSSPKPIAPRPRPPLPPLPSQSRSDEHRQRQMVRGLLALAVLVLMIVAALLR